jgi:hypothetical protein
MTEQQQEYITEALDMLGKGYDEEQNITDPSDLRKYRIELPNLYDDSDLDPYEFRLLSHYKRVGTCTESTRTTATKCHMSPAQVSVKRKSIRDKGFIKMQEVPLKKEGEFSYSITVVDMWLENFQKYSERSLSKQQRSPHEQSVHHMKQRKNHVKKEPVKKETTPQPPEILLYKEAVSHYPKPAQRDIVISAIKKVSSRLGRPVVIEDLTPFWKEWCRISGNEWSLVWLDEWAASGQIKNGNKNGKHITPAPPQESDTDLAARRAVADALFGVKV